MAQLSLILGNIFMCINQNYKELVWQKLKSHMITIMIIVSCELVRIRNELVW